MSADPQLITFAKLLRIALAYGSREERIRAMHNHKDGNIQFLASRLKYAGLLGEHSVTLPLEETNRS